LADISNNYDYSALPDFGFTGEHDSMALFIDPLPVTPLWTKSYRCYWDMPSRLINKEPIPLSYRQTLNKMFFEEFRNVDEKGRTPNERRLEALSSTEKSLDDLIVNLATIAAEVYDLQPRLWPNPKSINSAFSAIFEELNGAYESYRFFIDDANDAEPVSRRLCSERDLHFSYGLLEALVLIARFIPALRDITRKKSHPLHAEISKATVDKLFQRTQDCYRIIMTMAQCDIDRLKKSGLRRIREEVRQGSTGEALKTILSDRDVDFYAKEYIESAIEAYSGILKVKLN
jgi:N-terminal acetyltransferase B complex non-catalytic subunit